MYVNGCHIVSVLCSDSEDGFSSTVSRYRDASAEKPGDEPTVERAERGPFLTIKSAQVFAHAWSDFDSPPPMPANDSIVENHGEQKSVGQPDGGTSSQTLDAPIVPSADANT